MATLINSCGASAPSAWQKLLTPPIPKPISGQNRRGIICACLQGMTKDELQARSLNFAVDVRQLTQVIRDRPGGRGPADQLLDCATSVGANYRAACRARSRAEFIAKLGIVVEEIDEVVYWLEFVQRSGLSTGVDSAPALDEAKQLRAIFAASYGTARANHRRNNPKGRMRI